MPLVYSLIMPIEKHAQSTIDIYKEKFEIEILDTDGSILGKYQSICDVNAVSTPVYATIVQNTVMDFMAARERDIKVSSYEKDWSPYEPVKVKVKFI